MNSHNEMNNNANDQAKPVEVMPALRDEFGPSKCLRDTVKKYGSNYQLITELPFDIDTSNATNMESMFDGCSALTTVPVLDTSKVETMNGMFLNCKALTTVPSMDTSRVEDMEAMFYGCSSLTDGNVRLVGKYPGVETEGMIKNSGLTREPFC